MRIKVHFSTLLFGILLIFFGFSKEFFCIAVVLGLHEAGHILAAKRLKVEVLELDIYPFGGVAFLDPSIFIRPDLEILIALAGPFSNIFFAFLSELISQIFHLEMEHFVKANLMMAFFNLLPGLPLDGGRAFKSFLSCFLNFRTAVFIAVYSSYLISFALLWFFFSDIDHLEKSIFYLFLAIFLVIAANKEKNMTAFSQMRNLYRKKMEFQKKGLMSVYHVAAYEKMMLKDVIKGFMPSKYHVIIILDENLREKYRMTEAEFFEKALEYGLNSYIGDIVGDYQKHWRRNNGYKGKN
ncbi:M50 family metallopeptidase [Caldanaerobacter sp.]|uniref:M50 family metallopeptidase n=1 Tax=Caldanaerobacter sp. TaxID=2930036 RepID=UPI003C755456